MRCKKDDGSFTTVSWLYFYPQCSRIMQSVGMCNGKAGAFVPAVTVCSLRLF